MKRFGWRTRTAYAMWRAQPDPLVRKVTALCFVAAVVNLALIAVNVGVMFGLWVWLGD